MKNWIKEHKFWSIIIILFIISFVFAYFLSQNSEQSSLTGKFIDGNIQNTSEQEENFLSYPSKENSQINEQTNNNYIQEEESCEYKYLDEYRCNGESVERKRQNFDCSTDWIYGWKCYYGCKDGECIDKPEEETCEVKYLDEYKCEGDSVQQKYQYSDCSFGWFYYKTCSYGCSGGRCNPKPQEQSDYYKVTYIVDGDTLDVDTGERVRLICINTPERGEYYYSEAKEYLKSLTLNKEVDLIKDISETDRYGRLLRYIYLTDGTFVNELMVRNGYAKVYPYNPDTTLCPQIENAERIARENHLGIWAEEEETPPDNSGYICSYNAYNCADFSTHAQAQAVFEYCGGVNNDIHWLDGDKDGLACESLP